MIHSLSCNYFYLKSITGTELEKVFLLQLNERSLSTSDNGVAVPHPNGIGPHVRVGGDKVVQRGDRCSNLAIEGESHGSAVRVELIAQTAERVRIVTWSKPEWVRYSSISI